ncbi:hypothetical protein [Candidatus Poriferisodalis sp.]|uniref:hypothetical protein n=1 Tax=Candidatus Poriferisodalis sp. TaxID=3101277 RepID=UPI003AF576A2
MGTCILKSDAELFGERGAKGRYRVTPALLEGTQRVAQQSLDAYAGECGMRPGRLAAAMMAMGYWETPVTATSAPADLLYDVGDVKRDPARSLMTLSRGDYHQHGATGNNAVLYPDNFQTGDADGRVAPAGVLASRGRLLAARLLARGAESRRTR